MLAATAGPGAPADGFCQSVGLCVSRPGQQEAGTVALTSSVLPVRPCISRPACSVDGGPGPGWGWGVLSQRFRDKDFMGMASFSNEGNLHTKL